MRYSAALEELVQTSHITERVSVLIWWWSRKPWQEVNIYVDSFSMAFLTGLGMYPLSGVMGDKRTMDLLDPYEYVYNDLVADTRLTV